MLAETVLAGQEWRLWEAPGGAPVEADAHADEIDDVRRLD